MTINTAYRQIESGAVRRVRGHSQSGVRCRYNSRAMRLPRCQYTIQTIALPLSRKQFCRSILHLFITTYFCLSDLCAVVDNSVSIHDSISCCLVMLQKKGSKSLKHNTIFSPKNI